MIVLLSDRFCCSWLLCPFLIISHLLRDGNIHDVRPIPEVFFSWKTLLYVIIIYFIIKIWLGHLLWWMAKPWSTGFHTILHIGNLPSWTCLETTTTTTWYYYVNSRRDVDSEKSEPQMGYEPTTLRDLVGCSNHWATGDSVVSKGPIWGSDFSESTSLLEIT